MSSLAFPTILTRTSFSTSIRNLHVSSNLPRLTLSPVPPRLFHTTIPAGGFEDNDSGETDLAKMKPKHTMEVIGTQFSWEVEEDDEAMYARCDMPGLSKAGLKLSMEENRVIIKGEEVDRDPKFYKGNEKPRTYEGHILFPGYVDMDQMEADIKNGVLRVVIPKVK